MGSFSMNKVLGTLKKRPTAGSISSQDTSQVEPENHTPEGTAAHCVKQFCMSVGSASGDDVVFLPSIVESAVASPAAAAECARRIRKYMSKDYWTKPACQYNAIMLARILANNPGPGFTRFLDKKFIEATKELLRSCRDASVLQMLMETLDAFEHEKYGDENLRPLIEMWKKEKEKARQAYGGVVLVPPPPPVNPQPPHGYHRHGSHSKRLPDPVELASRLEEARTSAKLLEQVIACTPSNEILSNDLIKEFAGRCTRASRSIQGYMTAQNPAPDVDTMESLIDTNEQLQKALNLHHRAILRAKKQLTESQTQGTSNLAVPGSSSGSSPNPQLQTQSQQPSSPTSRLLAILPSRIPVSTSRGSEIQKSKSRNHDEYVPDSVMSGARHSVTNDDDNLQNPFRDPDPEVSCTVGRSMRFPDEPFHPGFGHNSGGNRATAAAGQQRPSTPVYNRDDDGSDLYSATPPRKRSG